MLRKSATVFSKAPLLATARNPFLASASRLSPSLTLLRNLFIQIENTPNPDSLKFLPGMEVLPQGVLDFPTPLTSVRNPLAKLLFEIEGVKGVMFGRDYITVTKTPKEEWRSMNPEIFQTITDFVDSGVPFNTELTQPSDTAVQEGDSEAVQMIKEILETRVKPAVQRDGGDIQFHSFQDGIVYLKMVGSCSGCPSSSVTLKGGIERMLMHWVPEVDGVVAVDDEELDRISREALANVEKKKED